MRKLALILCMILLTACTANNQLVKEIEYICPTLPSVPEKPEMYMVKFDCLDLDTMQQCTKDTKRLTYTIDVENSKNLLYNRMIEQAREKDLLLIIENIQKSVNDCNSLKNNKKQLFTFYHFDS